MMDNTRGDENPISNNSSKMENEFDNCTDDKVCVYETVTSGGSINEKLYDTDNKQRITHSYVTIKDENINDRMVVAFINEKPYDTEYKRGNIHNFVSIKDENIDDLHVVIPKTELKTDCTDDEVRPNETVYSKGYIKSETFDIKDEQGSIQNYLGLKEESIDDMTVVDQDTELMTDYMDNKVCIYETITSAGFIKREPDNMGDDVTASIHNNVDMKGCQECGEEYDLYCLKCPMLNRIFDNNNPDRTDNEVRRTLPKNFMDICESQYGLGVVALRTIPEGVVFGPFKGVDSIKDDVISRCTLKNDELAVIKDPEGSNWMQYIRRTDKSSHRNLVPFRYEHRLYYRSECHINVGDELLVHRDSDSKESDIQSMENSYWGPLICETLDDSYACTFCCVGYKSISHLKAHNSMCIRKRNKKDFCKEIVQCDACKIYLDKKEYSDYHTDQCDKSDGKCVFNSRCRRNSGRPLHNGDRPFSCTLCPYKATRKSHLKLHMTVHNDDKPFACTLCPYKTTRKAILKQHISIHNDDKSFSCTICPYKTNTKLNLKRHTVIHNADKPFACPLCPYKTTMKSHLKKHSVFHNDAKPFVCTFCPYKTKTKSNLKRHVVVHNDDKPFACTLCPYKTAKKEILKRHIAIHNDDKPFACTLCSYKTTIESALKRHMGVHKHDKAFECTVCLYKTTSKWHLKKHIVFHSDEKPFVCIFCPYKTKTKSNLKRHIVVHNDDRPFACTLCPYKTKTKSILKQHMSVHNNDKSYTCTLCPYKTKIKSILKRHMPVHNDDKSYTCTLPSACIK